MCLANWHALTSNDFVLGLVKGIRLHFREEPWQAGPPKEISMSPEEAELVDKEVAEMMTKVLLFLLSLFVASSFPISFW